MNTKHKLVLLITLFFLFGCNYATPRTSDIDIGATLAAASTQAQAPVEILQTPTLFSTPQTSGYVDPNIDRKSLTADQLVCDGSSKDQPCEDRKIRIRGLEDPSYCADGLVQGAEYSWFPTQPNVSWLILTRGLPEEKLRPLGQSADAGTKFTFEFENSDYYFVREPKLPPDTYYSLAKAEVTCAQAPALSEYYVPVTANWCEVLPDGRYTAKEGETYTFYGINTLFANNKGQQYSILVKLDQGVLSQFMTDGEWPTLYGNFELIVRQDFLPYILYKVMKPYGVILEDPESHDLYWGIEMFCDYWVDSQ